KHAILGALGFLAWYLSVAELGTILEASDEAFLRSLRLLDRPKAGVIYDLPRDYHEANFFHLAWNEVPVHYRWTANEEADGRFRRLSPAYWSEYVALKDATADEDAIQLEEFPSYDLWKDDLERYDWFFQDLRAGKRGKELSSHFFRPNWEYRIVDFRLWGARTITNWETIRAYSERFRGTVASTPYGTVCTFFRQNPRGLDEPAMLRERPSHHANELTDFAREELGPSEGEEEVWDGAAPSQARSPGSDHPSSGAESSFAGEFSDASREDGEIGVVQQRRELSVPYQRDVSLAGPWTERSSPREPRGRASIEDRAAAVAKIREWAARVTDPTPQIPEYEGLLWDLNWLGQAVLICDDERSALRMKAYAACSPGTESITDVLELAIRFGLPFEIYVPSSRVREFTRGKRVEALDQDTLDALYAPGYRDTLLTFGTGGAALYEQYRGLLNGLLRRPHAIAFIYAGGVLRFVAEQYDRNIVRRLVEGPSLQVTEHMAGRTRLLRRGADEEFFITDRVSSSEVSLLLGHIAGTKSSNESWLWPPPEVMESESLHMRGYLSSGATKILLNIRDDITNKKKFVWRTRADWKEYFRNGHKRSFTPATVPSPDDFADGARLFERTFPAKWADHYIADITIPEEFE
ncbi:hypothetical protein B0H15DRAFT_740334, partial [Mycena belliarum]